MRRFVAGTRIMWESPKAKLLRRNVEDFPELSIEEQLQEANRLLREAAGRKNYEVYSLKRDRARKVQGHAWLHRSHPAGQESHGGPSDSRV